MRKRKLNPNKFTIRYSAKLMCWMVFVPANAVIQDGTDYRYRLDFKHWDEACEWVQRVTKRGFV